MKQKLPFLLLIYGLVIADTIFTLSYANPGYWTNYNDYGTELNPIAAWALHHGPLVYLAHVALWMAMIGFLVLKLPRKLGFVIGVIFWLAHLTAVSGMLSWWIYIHYFSDWNFTIVVDIMNIYSITLTILLVLTWVKYWGLKLTREKPSRTKQRPARKTGPFS